MGPYPGFVLIYHSDGLNNMLFFQVCVLEMAASTGIAQQTVKDRERDPALWSTASMSSA